MSLPHQSIVDRAVEKLKGLPGLQAIWLTGSLARGDVVPGSDIDIHIALEVVQYTAIWTNRGSRQRIIECFEPCVVSVNGDFLRLLTAEGVVVDCGVHRAEQLESLKVNEMKVLYHFLRTPLPQVVEHNMRAQYPAEPMTAEQLRQLEIDLLVVLAAVPSMFHRHEWDSAKFQLDLLRVELIKLMYHQRHIRYAVRYKHFSEFLPRETLAYTYSDPHRRTLAQAYGHLVDLLREILVSLPGHYQPGHYNKLFETVAGNVGAQLRPFWSVHV